MRYLIEGSVRKAGERVRITGQLIDAITGAVSALQKWHQLFIKKPDVLEAFIAGLRKARLSE